MKHLLPLLLLTLLLLTTSSCQKTDTINCTITWQTYTHAKHITADQIQKAFQQTFFGYYPPLNDNTVRASNTTRREVRSLTMKLISMADALIEGEPNPEGQQIEIRVFINYGTTIEEIWSKDY